jgi:tetratricopeptide (TPR) repeat protein
LKKPDLEETMLRELKGGRDDSLERALLVIAGLKTEAEIGAYQCKIDDIFSRFLGKCDSGSISGRRPPPPYLHLQIAQCLFQYLWNSKPKRFCDCFLLTDVVNAQLDQDVNHPVGNCVGLTSLYSVLGLKAGLKLALLASSDHLISRLRVGRNVTDIDHTDPQGFDCHYSDNFREFPLQALPAHVFNSRGLENERCGRLADAKADYRKAVFANPEYANAFNNRGNMRLRELDLEGAISDYTEAIRLNPAFCEAYCNRGIAKGKLGLLREARQDFDLAIASNPEYGDAHRCLIALDGADSGLIPEK